MPFNYLPAIRYTLVNQNVTRQAPTRVDLNFGGGRTVLTDLAVFGNGREGVQTQDFSGTVFMRIGKWGLGYLTQDFYPLGCYNTKSRQEFLVWNFPRPYRLFPGERVTLEVGYETGISARQTTVPALMLNGVRVIDNRPVLLYANNGVRMAVGQTTRLNAETLQCPADSPVDVYSITMQPATISGSLTTVNNDSGVRMMIYGPDGRRWVENPYADGYTDPRGILMDLNKPEWILENGESFVCEFITPTDVMLDLRVVLRGQIEVSYANP